MICICVEHSYEGEILVMSLNPTGACQRENFLPGVEHHHSGPGQLVIVDQRINSHVYLGILQHKVSVALHKPR